MTLKYNIGDSVELANGQKLVIDTIKINKDGVFYYTQINNIMYRDTEIKGTWENKTIDNRPHFMKNASTKTKSNNKKVQ